MHIDDESPQEKMVRAVVRLAHVRSTHPEVISEAVIDLLGIAAAETDTVIVDTLYDVIDMLRKGKPLVNTLWIVKRRSTPQYLGEHEWVLTSARAELFTSLESAEAAAAVARLNNAVVVVEEYEQ